MYHSKYHKQRPRKPVKLSQADVLQELRRRELLAKELEARKEQKTEINLARDDFLYFKLHEIEQINLSLRKAEVILKEKQAQSETDIRTYKVTKDVDLLVKIIKGLTGIELLKVGLYEAKKARNDSTDNILSNLDSVISGVIREQQNRQLKYDILINDRL